LFQPVHRSQRSEARLFFGHTRCHVRFDQTVEVIAHLLIQLCFDPLTAK
jgi:hypothetical protein